MAKHDALGGIIREMRKNAGLTMKELCGGICAECTISRIERGETFPHEELIDQITARLGEKNFYERYIMGQKYQAHKEKETIKSGLIEATMAGELKCIEENLEKLKIAIENGASEDMQFYLTLQHIWYRMNGVVTEESSKRFIEIFEMTNTMPNAEESIRDVVDKINLSDTEHIIVNNIGLELLYEGKLQMGLKVLSGLYTCIYEKMPQCENKNRKLALVSNNCALAFIQCEMWEEALIFCRYAKDYSVKLNDMKLIMSSLSLEAKAMAGMGKFEDARKIRNYVSDLDRVLSDAIGPEIDFAAGNQWREAFVVL